MCINLLLVFTVIAAIGCSVTESKNISSRTRGPESKDVSVKTDDSLGQDDAANGMGKIVHVEQTGADPTPTPSVAPLGNDSEGEVDLEDLDPPAETEDTSFFGSKIGVTPAPFWRKTEKPTIAPEWYKNVSGPNKFVTFNSTLTSIQNGALLATVIENLTPGDHLEISAGTYSINKYFAVELIGGPSNPIAISGKNGDSVIITRPNTAQNNLNITKARYLLIQGIEFKGGDTGLKIYDVENLMVYECEIHDTNGNAIAANSNNTSFLYFVDNDIHHTGGHGEGFYLGAHDGTKITHHTFVVGNYVHDIMDDDVDQGDGIEIKDLSYAVTIKYNYITRTKFPGIVVYSTRRGLEDRNIIEENVVVHSDNYAIQVSQDAVVRNNLVVNNVNRGVTIKSYLGNPPRNLTVVNNTIISISNGIVLSDLAMAGAENLVIANNAIFSNSGQYITGSSGSGILAGNIEAVSLSVFEGINLAGTSLNGRPATISVLKDVSNINYEAVLDITGKTRLNHTVGAFD